MNLLNPFRAEIEHLRGGTWVNDAIDALMARINAVWLVEHNRDGTHNMITVPSGSGDKLLIGDNWGLVVTEGVGPTWNTVVWTSNPTANETRASLRATWNANEAILRVVATNLRTPTTICEIITDETWTYGDLKLLQQTELLGVTSGAVDKHLISLDAAVDTVSIDADALGAIFGSSIRERARTTPMGEWTAVTYASGNFTASTGSWTVDSGDQVTYAYTLIGKTMILAWDIVTTDVSANSVLRLAIPGSFTATKTMRAVHQASDAGGAAAFALARVTAGNGYVELFPTPGAGGTWTITAGDNTSTQGQMSFEVS